AGVRQGGVPHRLAVGERLDGGPVVQDAEVQVRAGGVAGAADVADGLAGLDLLPVADRHGPLAEVVVDGLPAVAVVEDDVVAGVGAAGGVLVEFAVVGRPDGAVGGGVDGDAGGLGGEAVGQAEVDAVVAVVGHGAAAVVAEAGARVEIDVVDDGPVLHRHAAQR